mmetsp:Transcript_17784/g.17486  ORF Transcript_17784/g.17486 Transcript_17784/m.17486 type:complete len:138 (+) Transcript_17784:32-445(+)
MEIGDGKVSSGVPVTQGNPPGASRQQHAYGIPVQEKGNCGVYANNQSLYGNGGNRSQGDPYLQNRIMMKPIPNVYGMTDPTMIDCPSCGHQGVTAIKYKVSVFQWIICLLLYIAFPILCFAPFYFRSCYQVMHSCPV